MTTADEQDLDPYPASFCRDGECGLPVIFTPDGWQHDCAPYFVRDGHEVVVDPDAAVEAARYIVDHCEHRRADDLPEPGDRCHDCGIELTWVGPGHNDWEPAVGAIPWRED